MRIALVHYTAPPVAGGVERVVGHQSVLLADAGHDVRLVAGRGASPDARVDLRSVPLVDSRDPDVAIVQEELDAGRVTGAFAGLRDRAVIELRAVLADVDVALCHNVCSLNKNLALTAAIHELVAQPDMPRFVLWHHDLAWTQPRYRPTLHEGYPWDLLRTAWPGVTQVAISEARRVELADLTGLPPSAITVIPNGVDIATLLRLDPETVRLLARTDMPVSDPLLLMPARVIARKNIELGLHVIAAMRALGRRAGLVVTGPVDPHDSHAEAYLDGLLRLRSTLGLDEAVWFPGAGIESGLRDAVVRDLYAVADALFLPSHDEGFGIPVLEAAVWRLPIVCSDLPVLREVAGDAALYLAPDDDPFEVASRVLALLDGDAVVRLAGNTRRTSSWEAVYRTMIEPLLRSIAVAPGPADDRSSP